jgi:hypothetical protein
MRDESVSAGDKARADGLARGFAVEPGKTSRGYGA